MFRKLNRLSAFGYRFVKYLLYFFIISNHFGINAQNYSTQDHFRIKYLTLEDGLSQVSINDILQDNSGFVWIATQDGLNRFDGKEFKHYKYSPSDSTSISGNLINKLLKDDKGNIWVGTIGNGLNYFDINLDLFYRIKLENSLDENEIISGLATNKQGSVWVASRISGLHKFLPKSDGSFLQIGYFTNQPLSALLLDKNENLWIGGVHGDIYKLNSLDDQSYTQKPQIIIKGIVQAFYNTDQHLLIGSDFGFYIHDFQTNETELFEFEKMGDHPTKHVLSFLKNDDSSVWVGTGNGLFLFDWVQKKVIKKITNSEGTNGLSNNTVQALLKLPNQQLVIGTANYLNFLDFNEPYFKNISKDKKGKHLLNDNVIFSIFRDENDLWIGTSDGGLNLIRNEQVYNFKENQNDPTTISGDVVRAIVKDKSNQRLWLATTRGLSMIDLKTFNPKNPKFTDFKHNPDDHNSINGDFIKDLALDRNNNLWGTTYGYGVFQLSIHNNEVKIIQYKNEIDNPNSLRNNYGQCIEVDSENNVWIGTQGGLTKLSFINNNYHKPVFINYYRDPNSKKPLTHNSVYDIFIDEEEQIWLGTRHGLNLLLGKNEFESWTAQKQFLNDVVYSIQDDEYGNFWLGTNEGIVKFNPTDKSFIQYGIEDGIQSNEFDIHAKFRDTNGYIYMGGIAGVTYFHPKDLEKIDIPKPLYFSQLRVKDKVIKSNKEQQNLLAQEISKTTELQFKNNQFPFYLQFSSIDFRLNKKVQFGYKLLPNDQEWNMLTDPEIQFLNLPAGSYTLLVNGFSRGKEWDQAPLEISLSILPPWWATWWAYAIYLTVVVFFADRFYRFQLSKRLALAESRRLKEVNQLKNTLFTNITHEFRTPLTVIKGMTSSIKSKIENKQLDDLENSLEMINRNSDELLHLVNEMLDLAKIESGTMELQLVQTNIIPFIKYLTQSFQSLAEEKGINFSVYSEIDHLEMDFDAKKLTTIVSNLLSNAIKFTSNNGDILIHIKRIHKKNSDFFVFEIKDSGLGIPKEELLHIFDKFYQVNNSSSRRGEGTGIGLALVKEFVELMNGTIKVKSTHGKGSIFKVKIPITTNAVKIDSSDLASASSVSKSKNAPILYTDDHTLEEVFNNQLPLVLIIEDNKDVAYYLKTCLREKYQTAHALNGSIGIEMAYEKIPDIVICDVMMPVKDGFEVCKSLKTNELTNHIPIIMLTAKATFEDRLTGLSHGADAYLTKPFEKAELLTRIDQLIILRKKMLSKFEKTGIERLLDRNIKNTETKFLDKIITIIHDNIIQGDFGPVQLALQLHLSESQLYRKLKAVSGKSTAIFIRSIRLQKGKELIQTTNLTISEIAYDVGFNDPSYFSRAFKKEFGHAPSNLNST